MTLQDIGSIGELVAAIATVITLVYLAVQIRQGTQVARSTQSDTTPYFVLPYRSNNHTVRGTPGDRPDTDRLLSDMRADLFDHVFPLFR
jgi:hypothetical protein